VAHIQTQAEWEEEMGFKVIDYLKSELYLEFPFMDIAFSVLKPIANPELRTFATDGIHLYYAPQWIMRIFKTNDKFLMRAYLHSILHCIYAHLWVRGNRDRRLWNLSCDIFVEYIIDGMNKTCTRRAKSWIREQTYARMRNDGRISAAQIYEWLLTVQEESMEDLQSLEKEFFTDDHRYWPEPKKDQPPQQAIQNKEAQKQWDKVSRQMQQKEEKSGRDPKEGEQILLSQLQAEKSRRSYSDFLKKFAVYHEELHSDPDEFDLSYYTYGLSRYGDMPLIEPLETRESKKIQEFVVVVDTSYSTSGELVKNFLKETFTILKDKNAFFRNCKIHIIQCDDQVRAVSEVKDERDLDELLKHFDLQGGGSTDFRPAFTYINEQIELGLIKNIGGLLYFTDGKGIYPAKKPTYKTAFLFLTEYDEAKIPSWAMRLKLDQEEFHEHITGEGRS
jgi:predicted metal-dependent peptidase